MSLVISCVSVCLTATVDRRTLVGLLELGDAFFDSRVDYFKPVNCFYVASQRAMMTQCWQRP